MDETQKDLPQTSENKHVLPDVVHSQQIPTLEAVEKVADSEIVTRESEQVVCDVSQDIDDVTTESISEHIPQVEYSITESEPRLPHSPDLPKPDPSDNTNSTLNPPICQAIALSPNQQDSAHHSTSWNLEINQSDNRISEESPVILALSSDTSKDAQKSEQVPEDFSNNSPSNNTPHDSARSEYTDSLNSSLNENPDSTNLPNESSPSLEKSAGSLEQCSTGSEEIIKLDIRGQAAPKFALQAAKIIFGPPPSGSTVIGPTLEPIPVFRNLLSPCLVGANDGVKIEEVFEGGTSPLKEDTLDKSLTPSSGSEKVERDVLLEEIIVEDNLKEKCSTDVTPPKSFIPDETISLTTMSTDYRTICEEFNTKFVHLEEAISKRDQIIEELTVSLQRSVDEREHLKRENEHLTNEIHNLQHIIGEKSQSDHDTIKAHLSDFIKHQSFIKGDSTMYYSALVSGTTSLQSSNGEKDMDREEITVNYSKSDLRSSSSDEFQTGFENKLTLILNNFEGCIEDNMRNKLRESLIHLLGDEIAKMRVDFDTDIKELEMQLKQDKQASVIESRRLRELLSSVKAGNADIDVLREELSIKHEKEMENLRTYFEKKCSDMERSYSEEVWHARSRVSPAASACELDYDPAAGDAKRRARSVDFSSLNIETSTPVESTLKQINRKLEQQLLEMKAEHVAYVNELQARHGESVAAYEEQIIRLKAHIQTADNTEPNVSLYQQDIDLELEKGGGRDDDVRKLVLQQLQEQLQVLLSDPDAELSSWPLELVALRDRIHAERSSQEKELSIREEAAGEADKWRQRRNNSFDQNRQLEEVTKERDGLRRVAATLQRAVAQLVAYCASAEDELNRTVLAHLLGPLLHDQTIDFESRPSSPNQTELNTSVVSRGKHVHFAPDLDSILVSLDEEGVVGFLQQQRDISLDIKNELEHSLKRLRNEAQELLELSTRLSTTKARQETKMLESNPLQITEMGEELDNTCENCQLQRRNMEEAMSECLQRESLLRSDLEAAMVKIALLLGERAHSDVIAEGYGTGAGTGAVSVACRSLDDVSSPRTQLTRVAHDLDAALRDRDDMQQQLDAANRQLKSTRQFVEEQAAEREAERDEFAARLQDLREENARLAARLQTNARILGEVEQLETQTREMNQIITELETKKAATDDQLKTTEEKIGLLRDIIADLENQLEQKTVRETEVLEQLEQMKKTIDERDSKMRAVLGELESLKSERIDQSEVTCLKCCQEEDRYTELVEKVKEQARWLEHKLARSTRRLERAHERSSACTSERTEDVSLRDKDAHLEMDSPEWSPSPRVEPLLELSRVWERLDAHARAEDAVLKRVADLEMQRAQLKDVAQEVRAERDVLQARMSEQALRISSLSARLQQQRNDAEALAHSAASQLSVQLHDTQAEVQRLKEELESKDKQLQRLKQNLEERDKNGEQKQSIYGNSCNPKDKVIILERELSNAQSKIAQLESIVRGLESDRDKLQATVREQQRALAEKEEQLNEIMALKLEDEQNPKSEAIEGKASARTLSDIVSISEYDEQDLQMRRAELKGQNMSINVNESRDKTHLNRTLPPEVQRPNMSSLNVEFGDNFDVNYTPRADSLPVHLTSTQNRVLYTRNANETTIFGNGAKHSTAQNIPDNCSMYPNRDVSESKDINVEPKKINFSLEPGDNKTENEEFTSLRELGITLDIKQENFPDILTQLKHEIKKSKTELEVCKSELKNAEEQLCEFPALKEEVEELKGLLENTMATMENDKKFYENQLESFSSNKKLLEQRLTEMSQEASEKSKDLHLLKEDILRRENMILELAKEKRNLTSKISELEVKISELQSRNTILEKCESENKQMRDKINELQKLEQLVTEKNQQIDSLNQHLDRLDDLQRCLDDKNEEMATIKAALEEKTNELFQMQDSVVTLTRDIAKVIEENDQLSSENKELKLQLTKLEKEQENASLKLQNSETELERVNSLNNDLASRIEELKLLNDKLKDKETEIEILQEDFNTYHNEIAALKEQLKMVSRSPSPRNKNGEDRKTADRQASSDKRQLAKIKKQISLLQHELDFHKKELNDKAFELAKAKLDLTEARTNLSGLTKELSAREAANGDLQQRAGSLQQQLGQLHAEKQQLEQQLEVVVARLREESNVSELKQKLREKAEKCRELEAELINMKELVERVKRSPSLETSDERRALAVRSPTAELERALRDQLHYSHTLDEDIMEQILSASSDEREDIPRLALNSSNRSSSSIHSSSSERLHRLRSDNEKLQLQVNNLECRLKDKDALIAELNRVRDKLSQECQSARLRLEAERDNSARLALLLDSHKDTADTLHNQDSSMIDMLKRRLESAMKSELEVQEREQALLRRLHQLERALPPAEPADQLRQEMEKSERLKGEVSLLKCKLDMEQRRCSELQAQLEHVRSAAHRDADARIQLCTQLKEELAELRRLKHETGVELARSKELVHTQSATIAQLEKKLAAAARNRNSDTFTAIENEKTELAREISSLRRCLTVDSPGATSDKQQVQQLQQQVQQLRAQLEAKTQQLSNDEKEQAIRYLHGRWARLESCRKALVWQKRYLQRVVAGYAELERRVRAAGSDTPPPRGLRRFKCVCHQIRYLHGRWARLESCRKALVWQKRYLQRVVAGYAELERRVRAAGSDTPPPRGLRRFKCVCHQIRYLHGRWARLESCRKALVWQKRYLQRVVAGYAELERRVRAAGSDTPPPRGLRRFKCVCHQIRYLHGRWARLESCRKALVWQKRYLQRVVAGYAELERRVRAAGSDTPPPRGLRRFKCVCHQIRYLHGRWARLESCRKALVWQKRYLQRVVAGYAELERRVRAAGSDTPPPRGLRRFKCVCHQIRYLHGRWARLESCRKALVWQKRYLQRVVAGYAELERRVRAAGSDTPPPRGLRRFKCVCHQIRYLHGRWARLESCRKALVWQKRYLQRVVAGYAELERRVRAAGSDTPPPRGLRRFKCVCHQIRYLHGRWARLESCRKALVWQKRYLQRVVAGYAELERRIRVASSDTPPPRGLRRFKCVCHQIRYLHGRWARLESCRKALVWQKRYLQRVVAGYAELERRVRAAGSDTPPPRGLRRFKCVCHQIRYLHGRWARLESCRKALVWQKRYLQRVVAGYAELERRVRAAGSDTPPPRGLRRFKCVCHQIRYLHGRWARLESCRKALVWQKRYLQRVVAGYAELERRVRAAGSDTPPPRGLRRFKCAAWAAVAAARMSFLVRRREAARALAANALFRPNAAGQAPQPMTPFSSTPAPRELRPAGRAPLARRLLDLKLPASPSGDSIRRSPFSVHQPQEEQVPLTSPRTDTAASFLQRLDAVSRRLQAGASRDAGRDNP